MDRPPERVLQALPDPDRVATMYGELGNKLVRAVAASAGGCSPKRLGKPLLTITRIGSTCQTHPSPHPSPALPNRDRPRRDPGSA